MPLTTTGRNAIASNIIGAGTPFNHANAYIGVGDGDTAFNVAQTDLQASSNKLRKGMEAGYPSIATNAITFQSVFDSDEANFDWEEWGVFNASTSGTMINRVVESLGTKTDEQAWRLTVTLTVAIGA